MKDSNIRDSYQQYIDRVTTQISDLQGKISMTKSELSSFRKLFDEFVSKYSINWTYYNNCLSSTATKVPTIEELNKIKVDEITFEFDNRSITLDFFYPFIEKIISLLIELYSYRDLLRKANNNKIPYYLYYYIIEQYYESVAISLLQGAYYYIKNIGILRVVIKKTAYERKKINWGESLKVLKEFAAKNYPNIYDDFITRRIGKLDFIDTLKPYLYDENTNPTGFKWLVHITNQFSPWLSYSKNNCNIVSKYQFSIVPTNYCNTKERSQSVFVKSCRKEEDILYCEKLGFRDKLNALIAFNPNYIDNFPILERCQTID